VFLMWVCLKMRQMYKKEETRLRMRNDARARWDTKTGLRGLSGVRREDGGVKKRVRAGASAAGGGRAARRSPPTKTQKHTRRALKLGPQHSNIRTTSPLPEQLLQRPASSHPNSATATATQQQAAQPCFAFESSKRENAERENAGRPGGDGAVLDARDAGGRDLGRSWRAQAQGRPQVRGERERRRLFFPFGGK
jgi:hypothetical protein